MTGGTDTVRESIRTLLLCVLLPRLDTLLGYDLPALHDPLPRLSETGTGRD
jgi:hypothetical protein